MTKGEGSGRISASNAKAFSIGALTSTAILVLPVMLSQNLRINLSQAMFDCGIKISGNVSGGTLSNFHIEGHEHGICFNGIPTNIELINNSIK